MSIEKIVRQLYVQYNGRQLAEASAHMAEDGQVVMVPTGVHFQGSDGYLQYLQSWAEAFPDSTVELTNVIATEDKAVAQFHGRGTHTGPLQTPEGPIPPTGKQVDIPFCEVFRFENGRIASIENYFDSATMMRQLGLIG